MGWVRLGAVSAAAVLGWASASSAATVVMTADPAPGEGVTYVFDVTGAYNLSAFSEADYRWYWNSPLYFDGETWVTMLDSESDTLAAGCTTNKACSAKSWVYPVAGSYLAVWAVSDGAHVTFTFENRTKGYSHCDDGSVGSTCRVDFLTGGGSMSFDYVGTLGDYTVTRYAAPEPATWAMMIAGFGLVGAVLRRRRAPLTAAQPAA